MNSLKMIALSLNHIYVGEVEEIDFLKGNMRIKGKEGIFSIDNFVIGQAQGTYDQNGNEDYQILNRYPFKREQK